MKLTRTVSAFNTATASGNKIHADDVAGKFGFTGGLVPGVDVFAYMAHAPCAHWGHEFLEGGAMHARFLKPVYDGDAATHVAEVDGPHMNLALSARGTLCATGEALRVATEAVETALPQAPPPDWPDVPAASPESLKPGTVLGTLHETYFSDEARRHLRDVREDHAVFDEGRIAHPAYLLRRANYVLAYAVRLGPWIHTASTVRFFGVLHDGAPFETRAVVAENIEEKGHLIARLNFVILSRGRPVMAGLHEAIYEPRQVRAERSRVM